MKPIYYLLALFLIISSCSNNDTKQEPAGKINIRYNNTLETVMILRALSDTDYFISRIADTAKGWPMLYKARKYFASHKQHPAVSETQRLLYSAGDIGGQLFQGVLYAKELPETGMWSEPADDYWKEHRAELDKYLELLSDFYSKANVAGFFEQNSSFYDGAIAEASEYVNDSMTAVMEDYFGKQSKSYEMYILPMCPYGWGFSGTVQQDSGALQYAIISPVTDVGWDEKQTETNEFGFGGEEAKAHYRELVVHEFVHTFITDVLLQDKYKQMIAQFDSLYTPMLDSVMGEIGYANWWGFVNEHIVRLGHIRVARLVDNIEADELINADVKEYKFILLPDAEGRIKEYEQHRDKYKTIDDFLPELIKQFGDYSRKEIDEKIMATG